MVFCWLFLAGWVWPDTISDQIERAILELSNQARQQVGVAELHWEPSLSEAARGHCQDMAELNFFDHDSPIPRKHDAGARVQAAGGRAGLVAENLYWSSGHPPDKIAPLALEKWLQSSGHRENLLGGEYTRVGVGVFRRGQTFWITQVFAD
jgi:uncharacterized protein YkwD